jgi:hypothetical protein
MQGRPDNAWSGSLERRSPHGGGFGKWYGMEVDQALGASAGITLT